MINFNDMFGNQNSYQVDIPTTKIDEFIDRVITDKDETLHSMAQALQWKLQQAPMISVAEANTYPLVINRIIERMGK